MRTTTAHTMPARYAGELKVTVKLTFDAIRNAAGFPLAVLGASVAYRVNTGDGNVAGDDLPSPIGFRSRPANYLFLRCAASWRRTGSTRRTTVTTRQAWSTATAGRRAEPAT